MRKRSGNLAVSQTNAGTDIRCLGLGPFLTVESKDTISAKGRTQEADFLLNSGAITTTLGDVGVPVLVIEDFTSTAEIDAALRDLYDI